MIGRRGKKKNIGNRRKENGAGLYGHQQQGKSVYGGAVKDKPLLYHMT